MGKIITKKVELKSKMKLLCFIGQALHEYGTSAPRLESILSKLAITLNLKGNFFSTPTYLAISIDSVNAEGDFEQLHQHIRVKPGEANLFKMQLIDEVALQVAHQEISINEAIEKIKKIKELTPRFSKPLIILAFALTSLALSVIFKGGSIEVTLSLLFGTIVGVLAVLTTLSQKMADIFEFLSAFLVMFLCSIIYHHLTTFNYQIVLICSLIVIIPGLSLTIAMNELATNNLVSGTARLMGAFMTFFKIAFGILVAAEVGKLLNSPLGETEAIALPSFYYFPALVLSCIAFTIIFKAHYKDFKWILFSGIVTLGSLRLGELYVSQILAIFLTAFTIGFLSNLISKIRNKPAAVTLLPGIIFIVPGTIGMKGINLIFQSDYIGGLSGGFQSIVLSITIVAGLFFANSIMPPRKEL